MSHSYRNKLWWCGESDLVDNRLEWKLGYHLGDFGSTSCKRHWLGVVIMEMERSKWMCQWTGCEWRKERNRKTIPRFRLVYLDGQYHHLLDWGRPGSNKQGLGRRCWGDISQVPFLLCQGGDKYWCFKYKCERGRWIHKTESTGRERRKNVSGNPR